MVAESQAGRVYWMVKKPKPHTDNKENRRGKFTYDYYKELVCHLREVYDFTTFREGKAIIGQVDKPLVIMRHDIDSDLEAAVTMSSLERDLGIYSTYFFMVRCPLYNIFSKRGSEQVEQMMTDSELKEITKRLKELGYL